MLGHEPWRHRSIYSAIVAFGSIFNDLKFKRDERQIEVPLRYISQDRGEGRRKDEARTQPDFWQNVPRMSYWIPDAPQYQPDRNRNQLGKVRAPQTGSDERTFFYTPAPFTLPIEASIITKYEDDMWQIQEQILPFFRPEYTVSVYEPTGGSIDIPFTLSGTNLMHEFEGMMDEPSRRIEWTLNFDALIYLWGPERRSKIITQTQIDLEKETDDGVYQLVEQFYVPEGE